MHGRPLAAVGVLLALAMSSSALADSVTVKDNWNTRSNLFDIEETSASHEGDALKHSVSTYHPWRTRDLRSTRRRPRAICIYIWRIGHSTAGKQDYEVCARYRHNKLSAYAWKARPKRRIVGSVKVARPDLNTITFIFTKGLIESERLYRWQTVTGFTGKGCPRDPPFQFGCDDSAPTRRVMTHDLRTPAPAPAPPGS
jgi:hypothetical protein